jgi:glycosyltransferase involved in cell wall biosynthesis
MMSAAARAFETFQPFAQSALIKIIFVNDLMIGDCTRFAKSAAAEIRSFDKIEEAGLSTLATSMVVTNFSELPAIRERFLNANLSRIPYLLIEIDSDTDIVKVVSDASMASDRYVVFDRQSDFLRAGVHHDFDVSVVVPVYKIATYVGRCVASLLDQRFGGHFEVLFIDDGTPDDSIDVISRLIQNRPEFRVIHKENGGPASARNLGMALAVGEFVGFVDGDDYVSSNYVDALFRAAIMNDCDISQGAFAYVNEATGQIAEHPEWFRTHPGKLSAVSSPAFYMMEQTPGIWRRLYSRRFLETRRLSFVERFRQHDDLAFNIEALTESGPIAVTRECVYYYRVERTGQTVAAKDRRLFVHFEIFNYLFGRLRHRLWHIEFYKTYMKTMFSHHLWAYEKLAPELRTEYLRHLSKQVFGSSGPIATIDRALYLRREFPTRLGMIAKILILHAF